MIEPNRLVLSALRELTSRTSAPILIKDGRMVNVATNKEISYGDDFALEVPSAVDGLIRDGYVIELDAYHFRLTDKGLHPLAFVMEDVKVIVISIIVSVITAILTTLATNGILSWLR